MNNSCKIRNMTKPRSEIRHPRGNPFITADSRMKAAFQKTKVYFCIDNRGAMW